MLEVKHIQGSVTVTYGEDDHYVYKNHMDALLGHVMRVCGIKFKYELCNALSLHRAGISRCRNGSEIPEHWYLRLHEYSGVPVADLRALTNQVNKYKRLK